MSAPTPNLPAPEETRLVLADGEGLGTISVNMQSFFEFSFWMAEELEELVATHRIQSRQPDLFSR
ncbi:MAG: hypothetical protein KDB14_03170 [Planctomycetales bacterium]|nr:hypothetical protein [Planctomycetales bacterium]